jgi:hypothetical protein
MREQEPRRHEHRFPVRHGRADPAARRPAALPGRGTRAARRLHGSRSRGGHRPGTPEPAAEDLNPGAVLETLPPQQPQAPRDSRPDRGYWNLLNKAEQAALRELGRPGEFRPGGILCTEGEQSTHVFMLITGWVKILSAAGRRPRAASRATRPGRHRRRNRRRMRRLPDRHRQGRRPRPVTHRPV